MKRVKCMNCKVDIVALRSTRRTCSDACRQALRRKANQEEKAIERAWEARRRPPAPEPEPKEMECRDCGIRQPAGTRTCGVCGGDYLYTIIPDMV